MSRVVLLIEHEENRRLLAEWLSQHHEVAVCDSPTMLDGAFDLAIVDGPSLERHGRWIEAVKRSVAPLFLPFLFVVRRGSTTGVSNAWEKVDELIVSPVEKSELDARVHTLLRARALSVANASLSTRLEAELARAREVQCGLLPRDSPSLVGFDLAARCLPANEVGGDFFDWQAVDDAAVLTVGDVMGKGVPAALLAATVRAVLRALVQQNPPASALDRLHQTLSGDLERTSSFVTLFHARLPIGHHEVRYVDAGHGHSFVRRAHGALERLERGGRPIGFPARNGYQEATLRLDPGDTLFVYSDGLYEGAAPTELIDAVDVQAPASEIVDQVIERAPRSVIADDITVLVLKCTEQAA